MRQHKAEIKYLHIRIDPELMRYLKSEAAKAGVLLHEYVDSILRLRVQAKERRGAA